MRTRIPELRKGAIEIGHKINTLRVNQHHSQLALNAENASYLFQPHSLHPLTYTPQALIAVDNYVETAVKRQTAKSQQVCFIFEDGSVKSDRNKKEINTILSTGQGIHEYLLQQHFQSRIHLKQMFPNPDQIYHDFIIDMFRRAYLKYSQGKDNANIQIKAIIENAPKEHALSLRRNTESIPGELPEEIVRKRTDQVIVSSVIRDLKLMGDMLLLANKNPNISFIVIRGTSHIGLATLSDVLATHAYQDFKKYVPDVDKKRSVQVSPDEFIEGPMLWNRKFWEKLIELNPRILHVASLMHVRGFFDTVASAVRTLLKSEPWNRYLDVTIHNTTQANNNSHKKKFLNYVLSQDDFQN